MTGTYRARELMSGWGMSASYFDHVPYYGGTYPAPNILTALETNDILARALERAAVQRAVDVVHDRRPAR